jgi:hypothetical protein
MHGNNGLLKKVYPTKGVKKQQNLTQDKPNLFKALSGKPQYGDRRINDMKKKK